MRYLLRADLRCRALVDRSEKRNLFFKALTRLGLAAFRYTWVYQAAFTRFCVSTRPARLRNRCRYSFSGASPRRYYHVSRNVFRQWAGSGVLFGIQRSSW
jgi:ribosomal protein S14